MSHNCPVCGKELKYKESKVCRDCYRANAPKGEDCPAYIDGRSKPKCLDCGVEVKDSYSKRCRACYNISRTSKPKSHKYFCQDCGAPIVRGALRCKPCKGKAMLGSSNPSWKGGRHVPKTRDGYILVYSPTHVHATKKGYVAEHRKVMSDYLGRKLESWEHVHHKDGDKLNNSLDNLELLSNVEHMKEHMSHKKKVLPSEEKQIVDLYQYGFSTVEIGNMFSTSPGTISRYLKLNGLSEMLDSRVAKYLSSEEAEELVFLYSTGVAPGELAKEYGISFSSVCYHLRKSGVEMKRSHNNGRKKS